LAQPSGKVAHYVGAVDLKTVHLVLSGRYIQTAVSFYEKLGFKAYGDIFLDAGIKHVNMKYDV